MTENPETEILESAEGKALESILDKFMDHVDQDVADAIRFCAMPHWFNENIIAYFRNEASPSKRSQEILALMTNLTFVMPYTERGWKYHKWVRALLLNRWTEKEEKVFRELSLGFANHVKNLKNYEHEFIYHLLCAGDRKGFDLLKEALSRANQLSRYSTAEHLLKFGEEPCIKLSQEQRWYLQYYSGELAAVSGYWGEALELLDSLQDQELPEPLRAKVFARMGTAYNRLGKWREAVESYQRSIQFGEKVAPDIRAWTYTGLGLIFKWQGKWEQAKDCNTAAMAIAKQAENRLWLSRALNNLGEINQLQGHWEEARRFYEESVQIKKQIDDQYGLIWTHINLGSLYTDQQDWGKASDYLLKGLGLARELSSLPEEAWALESLGELSRRQGRYEEAAVHFARGLEICTKLGEPYRKARIEAGLGKLLEDQGNYEGALVQFEKALKVFEQLEVYEAGRVQRDINSVRASLEQKAT